MGMRCVVRGCLLGVLLPACALAAEPEAFVFRHGFDTCGAAALSRADLRALLAASAGAVCIPPQTFDAGIGDVVTCGEPDCAGGVAGCPVTIRIDSVDDSFSDTQVSYQVAGTVDPFVVPVSGLIDCDLAISGALHDDTVLLDTAGDEEGRFLTRLAGVSVDLHSYTTSGCSGLASLLPLIEAQAESAAADALAAGAAEVLPGLSVCPLVEP